MSGLGYDPTEIFHSLTINLLSVHLKLPEGGVEYWAASGDEDKKADMLYVVAVGNVQRSILSLREPTTPAS